MLADILAGFLKDGTLVGIAVAFIGGWLLKKWPAFGNEFIPIATFVISVITQFVNFFGAHAPGAPVVHSAFLAAGFFDSTLVKAIIAAVLQWVLTDKTYETQKKALCAIAEN